MDEEGKKYMVAYYFDRYIDAPKTETKNFVFSPSLTFTTDN